MIKYILFLATMLPVLGFGQYEFYNQGALVYIQSQALVHVQGTFTNADASTAQVYNNGILEVKGDLSNASSTQNEFLYDPTVASTNRAVKFVGNITQHIIGNWTTRHNQSIYNLVVSQASAADTIEMQANVMVEGSLVFGSSNTTNSYNPTSAWTDNGSTGLLKTFRDHSSSGTFAQYLLNITNGRTDAIAGYPSNTSSFDAAPATGYIVTSGVRGNPGSLSAYTGLQRNDSLLAAYDYPIGSITHGYNAIEMNITSLPNGAQAVAGEFDDGTSNSNGYEGNISDVLICSTCSPTGNGPSTQPSFNEYFTSNPCSASDGPLWVVLEQSTKNTGYWSLGATGGDSYTYWVKAFMNNFTDNGTPDGTWRILQDKSSGTYSNGVTQYYTDPTNDDWTAQITSNIPTPEDLIYYSAYTATHGATSPSCYPLELGDADFGVPGGIYSGGGHFASFRENSNDALPVTLLSLTAEPINNQYIQVAWATSLEINNSGFWVQRSTDGVNFTNIGWVPGHGNTTAPENYTLNDTNVTANVVYYYQLNQVDFNGSSKQSNIVSAMITGSGFFAVGNFVPNPTSSSSRIIVTTSAALTIDVKLYDVIGQQLTAGKTYDLTAGENNLDFETEGFAAGNYTAVISAGNKIYTKRLVVVKN